MWYRIFCRADDAMAPGDLLAALRARDIPVEGRFRGDDQGWTAAEFTTGAGSPVHAECYRTDDDNLRTDLNTWAAYLETLDYAPNHVALMERVIQTQRLITVRKPIDHPNEVMTERLCEQLCQALAVAGDGVYQIENDGWYAGDGSLLLKEY